MTNEKPKVVPRLDQIANEEFKRTGTISDKTLHDIAVLIGNIEDDPHKPVPRPRPARWSWWKFWRRP